MNEFDQLHSLGLLEITAAEMLPIGNGWLLVVVRPIKSTIGLLGALSAGRLLDDQTLSELNFNRKDPRVALFNKEGNITAATNTDAPASAREWLEVDRDLWALAIGGQFVLDSGHIGSGQRTGYGQIKIDGQTAGVFGVALSTEATSSLRDKLVLENLVVLGLVSLFTLAGGFLLAKIIASPIKRLRDAALGIAAGRLDTRVDINSTDEIGSLANAFNYMAAEVSSATKNLKETNGRLQDGIGERQRVEKELRDALGQLRDTQSQVFRQERMRAMGEMASGIAHDFNNALSPIVSFSGMFLDSPDSLDDTEQALEDIRLIHTASQDATNVVKRLREFYREPDLDQETQELNVNQLVEQSVALTEPMWRGQSQARGVTIDVRTDLQEVPAVAGNESEFREALTNLIINAADALNQDGMITIGTRSDNEHAVIEVSDTGSGMSEEVRMRCLDPFFSTKGSQGTGMGLAMVYGIIERLRGTIDIASEEGKGTTFTIRLPFGNRSGDPKEQAEKRQDLEVARPLLVLVVDDDPRGRAVLERVLKADGHSVELAADGQEGLQAFEEGKFDLVVTDRAMPNMNGDLMAAAIRQAAPEVPVIMVTGFGDLMAGNSERPENIDIVVAKPIDPRELREAVMKLTSEA